MGDITKTLFGGGEKEQSSAQSSGANKEAKAARKRHSV